MAIVTTDDKYYQNIANAIRAKNGLDAKYKPNDMSAAIEALTGSHSGEDAVLSDTDIGDYYNDRITKLSSYAFAYRRSMTSAVLPNVTQMIAQAFTSCTGLVRVEMPNLASITSTANFNGCSALAAVDLGEASSIPASTFSNCASLKVLILRRAAGCSLGNINAFAGTPFAQGGSGGTAYVPATLVEAYKSSASNWSTLFGYGTVEFVALEGSEYE